jgi:hypothetical protein
MYAVQYTYVLSLQGFGQWKGCNYPDIPSNPFKGGKSGAYFPTNRTTDEGAYFSTNRTTDEGAYFSTNRSTNSPYFNWNIYTTF